MVKGEKMVNIDDVIILDKSQFSEFAKNSPPLSIVTTVSVTGSMYSWPDAYNAAYKKLKEEAVRLSGHIVEITREVNGGSLPHHEVCFFASIYQKPAIS